VIFPEDAEGELCGVALEDFNTFPFRLQEAESADSGREGRICQFCRKNLIS